MSCRFHRVWRGVVYRSPAANSLLTILLAFTVAVTTHTSEAAAVVTLSAPTVVEARENQSPAQRFESADIGLFDNTATASGPGQNGGSAGAHSHLRLDITPDQILISGDGGEVQPALILTVPPVRAIVRVSPFES